ncbi:baculoviral IAP repeat-containing protein 5-like [Pecten maximus]|uniref:baculoviral IAP repeat-containing protein 5-like n=1 Tax=Pecten maximus TaxID=6579 RepID=UPI0014589EF1|nr:baculoviral IAP repeat-containing protein 5-like [Pecten maximus]XP_033739610.1 baculoviral IAP repeat-containing protein 5-like [Pecten maximus]
MGDDSEYFMHTEDERLKSFKKWPFKTGSCSPAKMAAAGFYHCPTKEAPDACKCFVCFKELEGWERNDNPWDEHRKHSSACIFLNLDKPVEKLTMEEFVRLLMQIQKNRMIKKFAALKKEVEESSASVEATLESFRT